MAEPHSPITTWTTFPLPVANSFFVIYTEDPDPEASEVEAEAVNIKVWVRILRPLTEAPGHERSVWGRLESKPEQILIITAWKSRTALAEFEASAGYQTYRNGISKSGAPHVIHVDFGKALICKYLKGYSALTTIYFPNPVTSEQRESFDKVQGFVNDFGLGPNGLHLMANRFWPEKGWVQETEEVNGKVMQVAMFCHFWKSPDRERESKEELTFGGSINETVKKRDKWESQLRQAGAVEWFEDHCIFETLSTEWYDVDCP